VEPAAPRPRPRLPRAGPTALAAVLAGAVAVAAALAIAAGGRAGRAPETGSTLTATWVDEDGNGVLERGPGEPLRNRTELGPARRPVRTLATFAQITDAHVRDEESPGRLPVLDRLGPPFDDSFRPQEALSPQVLAGAVAAVDRLRPQAVAVTGDLADSAQANEFDQALAVLRGGRVDPDSGRGGYDGAQRATNPDPFFYRPGVDAPRRPGLLARAERSFRSPGLRAPWYPTIGNHDLLTQGVVAPSPRIVRAATGSRALAELDPDLPLPRSSRQLSPTLVDRLLGEGIGRTVRVPPDGRRRPLTAAEVLARLGRTGHTRPASPEERLDYVFDIGPRVRGIVLDTARRDAGAGGVLDSGQLAWLRSQLTSAGRRYLIVFSHHPLARSEGGRAALDALERDPRVLAAVSGHRHRNAITPLRARAGGLWLVETASLADFPQQARAFRVVETRDGGVAVETWMLDTVGNPLAGVARGLAYLDAQGGRPAGDRGERLDRNVRLELGHRG
jgi:3',5'-cyclic AMP phosphodiesterase CpdA